MSYSTQVLKEYNEWTGVMRRVSGVAVLSGNFGRAGPTVQIHLNLYAGQVQFANSKRAAAKGGSGCRAESGDSCLI